MAEEWRGNLINDVTGIVDAIRDTKTIAVLGIKPESHSDQPAFYVAAHMAAAGYDVIPVPVYYPDVTEILGKPVFRKLARNATPLMSPLRYASSPYTGTGASLPCRIRPRKGSSKHL